MTKTILKETRAVLDIETGGFSSDAGIVEVAIVVIDKNYQPLEKYSAIVQPYFIEDSEDLMTYSEHAVKIHGITLKQQKNEGKPPREVVKNIEAILQNHNVAELIGHNIEKFDAPRMSDFFERFSTYDHLKPFDEMELTDTLLIARFLLDLNSYSLASCCDYYGIINEDEHRALSDTLATAQLIQYLEE